MNRRISYVHFAYDTCGLGILRIENDLADDWSRIFLVAFLIIIARQKVENLNAKVTPRA